uniref:Olfactory receptor n=1 Tax=Nannospalax galili TaxID=1026970 RepID=A0A8C6RLS6_NANGA
VTEFILVGLTDVLEWHVPVFTIFTLIYLLTLVGKLGMILLILLDSRLHTPMYFFLSNLSLLDCVYASAVNPKVMERFLTGDKIISYNSCADQMFFFSAFVTVESFLLASMAFDRHAAVCKPLHYTTTMTSTMYVPIVTCFYFSVFLQSSINVAFTFHLFFCHSNVINHFFCDTPPVLDLSCSGIYINEIVLLILATLDIAFTLLVILNSYLLIFIIILRMRSAEGQRNAFATSIFMYPQLSSSHSMDNDKIASVFYTMVIPMVNPLVYNLRNKEVKRSFKNVLEKQIIYWV